jgi:hypothetical protein
MKQPRRSTSSSPKADGVPTLGRDPTPAEAQLAFMLEMVDIRPIKEIARRHFPADSKFRQVLEAEKDWIPRHEVVGKVIPWETLLKLETGG